MKNFFPKTLIIMGVLAMILTGCVNSGQTDDPEPEAADSDLAVALDEAAAAADETQESKPAENQAMEDENMEKKMIVEVGGSIFTATLEDNEAVDTLVEMMQENPITIQMRDYSGFEKVGSLGTDLPTNNSQTTTGAGDIVLYQGNQIVMFYGSNSWSYTRIGRIDDLTGWEEALGSGDVTVALSVED